MSESTESELLPCPFCGGEAYLYESVAAVECFNCGAKTVLKEHHEDIIADWNRRTPAAPQWTTEPPKEEGWYMVWYGKKYTDCIEIVTGRGKYDSYRLGTYEESVSPDERAQFHSIEDYTLKYHVAGWCKIDFPSAAVERKGEK